jgi:hypothetical protein
MTHRHHLIIDALGQALIILFYGLLLGKTENFLTILQIFPMALTGWQFVNGLLSYKFFERDSKKLYVRITGMIFIAIAAFWGLLLMLTQVSALAVIVGSVALPLIPFLIILMPILTTGMSLWYLYITIKDINIMLFRTI